MIVRELVAKLGLVTDKRSFEAADKRISNTQKALASIARFVSVGIVATGFSKLINLSSDANETLNVLNESFEKNSKSVQEWASSYGNAAGRSEFYMREMAGTLGSVLNPLMDNNADKAAEMATNLSELAVDLGSFFNKTDEQALVALRSGLTGQTEPMMQFGVVMHVAQLEAFALEKGLTKAFNTMSNAEKTQLRYEFLLAKTTKAQGDAIRTSEGFANASKGLLGGLRDLGTVIGLKFLPFVEKAIGGLRFLTKGLATLAKETNIVEVALVTLAVVGAAAGIKLLVAWLPVIAPFVLVAAKIGLLILVLEDLWTWLKGGESVIGDFIDWLYGPGSAAEASEFLRESFVSLVEFFKKDFPESINFVKEALDSMVDFFEAGINKIADLFGYLNEKIKEFTGLDIKAAFSFVGDKLGEGVQAINDKIAEETGYDFIHGAKVIARQRREKKERENRLIEEKKERERRNEFSVDEVLARKKESQEKSIEEKRKKREQKAEAARNKIKLAREKKEKAKEARQELLRVREAKKYAKEQGLTLVLDKKPQVTHLGKQNTPKVSVPQISNNKRVTNKIDQTVNVNIKGNVDKRNQSSVVEKVARAVSDVNKKTYNALTQVAE